LLPRKARSFVSIRDFDFMNDQMPPPLTPDELASLVNIAVETPTPKIPPIHLARPVLSGYLLMGPDGPRVSGDGLIRDHRKAHESASVLKSPGRTRNEA
jgi:hypothetical protein